MSIAVMSLPGGKVAISSPVPSARNRILPFIWPNSRSLYGRQRTSAPPPAIRSKFGAALSHFRWVMTSTMSDPLRVARDAAQQAVDDPDQDDPDKSGRCPKQNRVAERQDVHR